MAKESAAAMADPEQHTNEWNCRGSIVYRAEPSLPVTNRSTSQSTRARAGTRASPSSTVGRQFSRASQLRMLTARAATIATVISDAIDCAAIKLFAHSVSGIVSVGLNAVALVRLTYM